LDWEGFKKVGKFLAGHLRFPSGKFPSLAQGLVKEFWGNLKLGLPTPGYLLTFEMGVTPLLGNLSFLEGEPQVSTLNFFN